METLILGRQKENYENNMVNPIRLAHADAP